MSGLGLSCSEPPPLPEPRSGMSSLTTDVGNPLACGGSPDYKECWEYRPDLQGWVRGPDMLQERNQAAVAKFTNGSQWVVGGSRPDGKDNTEVYQSGEFVEGVSLPSSGINGYACVAAISDSTIFFADDVSYIFDVPASTFQATESELIFPALESQCGVATKADGRKIIVVAGGIVGEKQVQIFDLDTGLWRLAGANLPHYLRLGQVIPFGNTFLIAGGYNGRYPLNTEDQILEFHPDVESWIIREERMSISREGHYAALLNNESFQCQ